MSTEARVSRRAAYQRPQRDVQPKRRIETDRRAAFLQVFQGRGSAAVLNKQTKVDDDNLENIDDYFNSDDEPKSPMKKGNLSKNSQESLIVLDSPVTPAFIHQFAPALVPSDTDELIYSQISDSNYPPRSSLVPRDSRPSVALSSIGGRSTIHESMVSDKFSAFEVTVETLEHSELSTEANRSNRKSSEPRKSQSNGDLSAQMAHKRLSSARNAHEEDFLEASLVNASSVLDNHADSSNQSKTRKSSLSTHLSLNTSAKSISQGPLSISRTSAQSIPEDIVHDASSLQTPSKHSQSFINAVSFTSGKSNRNSTRNSHDSGIVEIDNHVAQPLYRTPDRSSVVILDLDEKESQQLASAKSQTPRLSVSFANSIGIKNLSTSKPNENPSPEQASEASPLVKTHHSSITNVQMEAAIENALESSQSGLFAAFKQGEKSKMLDQSQASSANHDRHTSISNAHANMDSHNQSVPMSISKSRSLIFEFDEDEANEDGVASEVHGDATEVVLEPTANTPTTFKNAGRSTKKGTQSPAAPRNALLMESISPENKSRISKKASSQADTTLREIATDSHPIESQNISTTTKQSTNRHVSEGPFPSQASLNVEPVSVDLPQNSPLNMLSGDEDSDLLSSEHGASLQHDLPQLPQQKRQAISDQNVEPLASVAGIPSKSTKTTASSKASKVPKKNSSSATRKGGKKNKGFVMEVADPEHTNTFAEADTRRGEIHPVNTDDEGYHSASKTGQKSSKRPQANYIVSSLQDAAIPTKESLEEADVRRSKRMRIKPLEFWKNERAVYHRKEKELPTIEVVIRVDKQEESDQLRVRHKPRSKPVFDSEKLPIPAQGELGALVFDKKLGTVEKHIAQTKEMLTFVDLKQLYEGFGDHTFSAEGIEVATALDHNNFATGVLRLRPSACKPVQNTFDLTEVFYLASGDIDVNCHKSEFTLSKGSFFFIPPHNSYTIRNLSDTKVAVMIFSIIRLK
eukprot:TRINITY_DN11398_c0_g1_i1.p1 TRINITY_DN11398_c0_g1~~TRINITY_DN11398_c0_g1_i1.p1  ORF type:complete len:975 (+),score=187.96 TRINITY_DN11398_c0_g1_i1:78-3002(+)